MFGLQQYNLQDISTYRVYRCIVMNGPISKRKIQDFTRLSWGCICNSTVKLLQMDVIKQNKQEARVPSGRIPSLFEINDEDNFCIGIDATQGRVIGVVTALDGSRLCSCTKMLSDNYASSVAACIMDMGNGGSASTASHFAGDFNKGLSLNREKRFRFYCLNDNAATVLSLANDVAYEAIYVEQLKNFLSEGDLVVAISGSGNSQNVINAVEYAKEKGNTVIGLTGYNGGKLHQLSDIKLHIPVNDMQIVEDLHMVFDHLIMSILYKEQ